MKIINWRLNNLVIIISLNLVLSSCAVLKKINHSNQTIPAQLNHISSMDVSFLETNFTNDSTKLALINFQNQIGNKLFSLEKNSRKNIIISNYSTMIGLAELNLLGIENTIFNTENFKNDFAAAIGALVEYNYDLTKLAKPFSPFILNQPLISLINYLFLIQPQKLNNQILAKLSKYFRHGYELITPGRYLTDTLNNWITYNSYGAFTKFPISDFQFNSLNLIALENFYLNWPNIITNNTNSIHFNLSKNLTSTIKLISPIQYCTNEKYSIINILLNNLINMRIVVPKKSYDLLNLNPRIIIKELSFCNKNPSKYYSLVLPKLTVSNLSNLLTNLLDSNIIKFNPKNLYKLTHFITINQLNFNDTGIYSNPSIAQKYNFPDTSTNLFGADINKFPTITIDKPFYFELTSPIYPIIFFQSKIYSVD